MILGEQLSARLARCVVAAGEKYLKYEQVAVPQTEYLTSNEHSHQVIFRMTNGRQFMVYVTEVEPNHVGI